MVKKKSVLEITPGNRYQEIIMNPWYTRLSLGIPEKYKSGDLSLESEKDLEKLEEVILRGVLKTSEFIEKLYNEKISPDLLLPRNCRFARIAKDQSSILLIIEESPRMRTIRVKSLLTEYEVLKTQGLHIPEYDDIIKNVSPSGSHYMLHLSFPYVVYIIILDPTGKLRIMYLFYRLQPISSWNDFLIRANLPNVDNGGNVCLGDALVYPSTGLDIQDATELVISAFWNGDFNKDLSSTFRLYREVSPDLAGYLPWQYYSIIDPSFIYNCKWIPYEENLSEMVQRLSLDYGMGRTTELNFDTIFNSSLISQDRKDKTKKKFYNLDKCLSYPIISTERISRGEDSDDRIVNIIDTTVNVGDDLILNNKKYYINSFIATQDRETDVELESEDGEIIVVNSKDKSFSKACQERIKISSEKEIQIGKQLFKVGDYLNFHGDTSLVRQITKIITQRDGRVFVKLGREFYSSQILSQEKITKFDVSNITFNGLKMKQGETYIMFHNDGDSYAEWIDAAYAKFKSFDFRGDSFNLRFELGKGSRTRDITLETPHDNQSSLLLVPNQEKGQFPHKILRVGDKLIRTDLPKYSFVYTKDKMLLVFSEERNDIPVQKNELIASHKQPKEMLQELCKDGTLTIPGTDLDISFSVGDKVIIADFSLLPLPEILKIRTITGFKIEVINETSPDKYNVALMVETVDINNNKLNYKYIFSENPSIVQIQIGKIRKIIPEINGLSYCTKVLASKKSIRGFPKKDIHYIVGFLPDTGTVPQILCSNGYSIWYTERSLSNYTFIEPGSKTFNKLSVTPMESTIKFNPQSLDLIVNNSGRRPLNSIVFNDRWNNGRLLTCNLSALSGSYASMDHIPTICTPYGILPERFSKEDLEDVVSICAIPNLHGGFRSFTTQRKLNFNVPRRFLDV